MHITQPLILLTATALALASSSARAGFFGEDSSPTTPTSSSYARGEVLNQGEADTGVIMSARRISIEASSTANAVGTGGGALAGAAAGSQIGKGKGKTLGGLAGALLGGLAGSAGADHVASRDGWELIIKTAAKLVTVVQAAEPGVTYRVGDRVYLVRSGGWNSPTRVILAPQEVAVVSAAPTTPVIAPPPPAVACTDQLAQAQDDLMQLQDEVARLQSERDRLAAQLKPSPKARAKSTPKPAATPTASAQPAPKPATTQIRLN